MNNSNRHSHNFINLTGRKFGYWKVLKLTNHQKRNNSNIWKCKCICGKVKFLTGNNLRNGSKSCGCKHNRRWRYGKYNVNARYTTIRNIMSRYNCEAKNRNLDFKLTFKEFKSLIFKSCFYCNIKKSSYQTCPNKIKLWYNGIDRVDNTKGYFLENCVTCCKSCNSKKKSITPEMIKKAYEFLFR